MELANLLLISYYKNKKMLEYLVEGKDEIDTLFSHKIACNAEPDFDEATSEHDDHCQYKILKWLFHTDRGVGTLKLRTLPFGFIAENKERKELFVVLRGTITSEEWRNNFSAKLTSNYGIDSKLGLVHAGFNSIFTSSYSDRIRSTRGLPSRIGRKLGLYKDPIPERRPSIAQDLLEEIVNKDWHRQNYRIYITGHSLGGALAMLAGQYILSQDQKDYKDRLSICTFAAPRVGNREFAQWFNDVDVVRYVNSEDIVPSVPPATGTLLGDDMNEFHDGQIKAEREKGFSNIDQTFGLRLGQIKGEHNNLSSASNTHTFEHVGIIRSFSDNRGSVSYNHNMKETYRQGIAKASSETQG